MVAVRLENGNVWQHDAGTVSLLAPFRWLNGTRLKEGLLIMAITRSSKRKQEPKGLTKLQILGIVEAGYNNKFIDFSEHVDEQGEFISETGDMLADFLIREVGGSFDLQQKKEAKNLGAAIDAVTKVKVQLESVITELENALMIGYLPPKSASKLL